MVCSPFNKLTDLFVLLFVFFAGLTGETLQIPREVAPLAMLGYILRKVHLACHRFSRYKGTFGKRERGCRNVYFNAAHP